MNYRRWWPSHRKPLTYTRVRGHLEGNTGSQFSGSDGMSKKRSITRRGPWSIPKPIGSRSYVSPWGDDHEYKSHHEGWGDRHHLHGHSNHLGWENGSQWPWREDPSPGAQDRGHNRPHLGSSQITAFRQWGDPTTTVEQINLPITTSGQKDYDAVGWQLYQTFPFIYILQ